MARGGKRPGAGRPKKDRTNQDYFESAEQYLEAVVQGRTTPDAVRVSAARALIKYQTPQQRAPLKSPTPTQIRDQEARSIEQAKLSEFEQKAAEIKRKLKTEGDKHGKV